MMHKYLEMDHALNMSRYAFNFVY